MEEEDSSGVAWPHDLLLLRDAARAGLRQMQAAEVHAAWMDNVRAAMNETLPWPQLPKRASFGFCGSAHSLAAAGSRHCQQPHTLLNSKSQLYFTLHVPTNYRHQPYSHRAC
jgi:hypothetical protein